MHYLENIKKIIDVKKSKKFFPQGFVVFDLETTGPSPINDQILEIAAIKIDKNYQLSEYEQLINPHILISPSNENIHGINNEMVKYSPRIEDVFHSFLDFIKGYILIAHSAKFDAGFISKMAFLMKCESDLKSVKVYDSCKIAKLAFPQLKKHNLAHLTESLQLNHENPHRALSDSVATTELVFKSFLTPHFTPHHLSDCFVYSFNQLENISNHPIILKLDGPLRNQSTVYIKYLGGHHKKIYRPIIPTCIIPMPKGAIIEAKCLISEERKNFILNKIQDVKYEMD